MTQSEISVAVYSQRTTMTQSEIIEALNAQRTIILDRESRLSSTDYIASKIAEGKATKTDYKDKIAKRQQWRDEIDAARAEIALLESLTPDPEPVPSVADEQQPSEPVPSVAAVQQPSTPTE